MAAVFTAVASGCGTAPDLQVAAPPTPAVSEFARPATQQILTKLQVKTGASDPRYYTDRVWYDGSPTCFRCTLGPAVLAAVQASTSGDAAALTVAVESLDRAISEHQRPNGSFGPAGPNEGGLDIQTVFFANELAEAYLILEPQLTRARKKLWVASLTKSADFLIRNGNVTFYTNGNINLAVAMNLDLTHRITRLARFQAAAQRSLDFTLNPPQDKWAGYGLQYTTTPDLPTGADGAAYLAEAEGGKPGYDPAYTLFQANIAAQWFLLTGHTEAHRLTNLLYNQMVPLVRTSDWTIDVGGGTRRPTPGVRYPFNVAALPVLALHGGREDLQHLVEPQLRATINTYQGGTTYSHPGISYGYGSELAPSILAVLTTPGW